MRCHRRLRSSFRRGRRPRCIWFPLDAANTSTNRITPFFPNLPREWVVGTGTAAGPDPMQAFDESCAEIRGETVRLVLPIEIQGVTNEYTLMFTAEQPEIVTWKSDDLAGLRGTQDGRDAGALRAVS